MTIFRRDGYLALRGALDIDWVRSLKQVVRDVCQAQRLDVVRALAPLSSQASTQAWVECDASRWHDELHRHLAQGPLCDLIAHLTGSERVRHLGEQLFHKPPQSAAATPLHQDMPCSQSDGESVAVVWVPLDAVTHATGPMLYLPGSHRWSKRFGPREGNAKVTAILDRQVGLSADVCENDPRLVAMRALPGDVIVHDWRVLHGSGGNRSRSLPRRTLSVRFGY